MSNLFNSDYEFNFNGKVTNADVLIKAAAETFITVLKGAKEAMAEGRPCVLENGCIRPVEEPAEAPADTQDEETVTVRKKDWEQVLRLAHLFREHPEASEGYKISVGADLAGTVLYVAEHIIE